MGSNYGCICFRKDQNINVEFDPERKQELLINLSKKGQWEKEEYEATDIAKTKIQQSRSVSINHLNDINYAKEEIKIPILHEKVASIIKLNGAFEPNEKEMSQLMQMNLIQRGTVIIENNLIYKGTWNEENQKEGFGEILFPDGGKFEGFFKNDMMNGRGRLINSQGDFYEGEFKNDKANNYGKYISGEGIRYAGFWMDDKQHGKGEETYIDGSKYIGYFENGEKSGKGKFSWPDGSIYEGDFEKNAINGKGIYQWKDGRKYHGDWVNNKMEGIGLFIWTDKKTYCGQYKDDKKSGYGIFIWPDGKRYEGNWLNGRHHGYGIMYANGEKRVGEWNNGQKVRWILDSIENIPILEKIITKLNEKANTFQFNEILTNII